MSRTAKDTSIVSKKKSACLNEFSIADAENFEPPQLSSTPSKRISYRKNSKRILKDNNSLNVSVINKQSQKKKQDNIEKDVEPCKLILPVIEENYKYEHVPELFCSDPEDESIETENITDTTNNESDDKWTTLSSDVSCDKNNTDISDLLAEIDADIEVRFEKPPRRSYPGRKRNNKSLYEDEEEKEETEVKTTKKDKKPKQKKKIDPQEEAFIESINDHFNDVETFNLAVE